MKKTFKDFLKEENIPTYTGSITVPKDWIDLSGLPQKYPGYTPGCKVSGNFYCYSCPNLKSLEGAPSSVGGSFNCSNCTSLTSLERAPSSVGGDFYCYDCTSLKSLKGAPSSVGGDFDCSYCPSLTSLKSAPSSVGGSFDCHKCTSITSLEGIGEHYILSATEFIANNTPISSHILGLLKVKNLKLAELENKEVEKIINAHLKGNRNIWKCQDELQDLDLDEYAQL